MNSTLDFWRNAYGVSSPLEVDSWAKRAFNRHIVAALMNAFPKTATKLFKSSKGELARLVFFEREGGSFLVLRAMYEHADPQKRGDFLNRLLMQSPAVKAARNRRIIAQRMLQLSLQSLPRDVPSLVLAIGGGDGSQEAEIIGGIGNPNLYLCIVDKDERAVRENAIVLNRLGLARKGVVFTDTASGISGLQAVLERANRHFGVDFDGLRVTVCQGITEYLDLGSTKNEEFGELLAAIHHCTKNEGCLLLGQTDYHDRVTYLERGLSWHMRLRGQAEIEEEIVKAGWKISVCMPEPMNLITMCSARKTAAESMRMDDPTRFPGLHSKRHLSVPLSRRSRI